MFPKAKENIIFYSFQETIIIIIIKYSKYIIKYIKNIFQLSE